MCRHIEKLMTKKPAVANQRKAKPAIQRSGGENQRKHGKKAAKESESSSWRKLKMWRKAIMV